MLPFRGSSSVALPDMMTDVPGSSNWNENTWNHRQIEVFQMPQGVSMDWQSVLRRSSSALARKILRMEVPVDRYPNFNFVGRLLGPRGNSLKRIEAATGCRIFIRGRGSIKDRAKEERLQGKPCYAHLNEPLHVVIDAHLPANVIDGQLMLAKEIIEEILKPVEESQDFYKRQQMRELAILNSIRA